MQNISTLSRKIIINELIDSFCVVLFYDWQRMKSMLHPLHRINQLLGTETRSDIQEDVFGYTGNTDFMVEQHYPTTQDTSVAYSVLKFLTTNIIRGSCPLKFNAEILHIFAPHTFSFFV